MKKSLISFCLPLLALVLTSSCKGDTSSSVTTAPSVTTTPSSPSSSSSISSSSISVNSTPTKKTQNEERYDEFNSYSATSIVYALGKVVQIEKYKYQTNVNVYVQDGVYFYQVINVPSEMVELNSYYQFQGEK
ncbi:MAG TPA: hypothetical protein DCY93_02510 [Firmicutes bacterium]|nr:hypothetical protein [Bacillota bacterium]